MPNYYGSKTDIISEIGSEIDSELGNINDELKRLEDIDWNEIKDELEGDDIIEEIVDAIDAIRYSLENLRG